MNGNLSRLQSPRITAELSGRKGEEIYRINVKTKEERGQKCINNTSEYLLFIGKACFSK